jgi:plasmid stabilization system protein ParE
MHIVIRAEAREEMRAAQAWYEERAIGLGGEFARAVDAAIARAARNPAGFPIVEGEMRRVVLRRFPYLIAYAAHAETLVVLACFHLRRNPQRLSQRGGAERDRGRGAGK